MKARLALSALVLDLGALGALAAPARAQTETLGSTAPTVYPDDPEYRAQPIRLGGLSLTTNANVRLNYDSNIYAAPIERYDDVYADFSGEVRADSSPGPVTLTGGVTGTVRRYASRSTENSERWRLDATVKWSPSRTSLYSLGASLQRAVEDRSDSEARTNPDRGPRRFDILATEFHLRTQPGRLLFDLQASATRFDALSGIDADRDFSAYNGQAAVGLRVGGTVFVTASTFVNRREFRLSRTPAGFERDTTTYGGQLGLNVEPGGLFEGRLGVGVFRYDPDEPTAPGRTGLSVSGALIYRPSRRTALLLDAFNGDVATFRTGAQGRTDTRLRLTAEQEIRHNLFAKLSGSFRRSKFVGTGISEDTATVSGEIEHVIARNISISLDAQFSKRTSERFAARFERFRAGFSLRARF
ncbi:outer membrane beta-barrel protein [Novosphingobium profundi]|uniref:outer membrane beta-barrel protein n=1 Tax=Novosphingobium profundi TaxID=1774954 RepID=UPI001CFD53C7|nr:outer membrane beta-barrel protein [Novosphingobium profundi]